MDSVTKRLFQEPGQSFGIDLAALNIHRAREHGVPSYNEYREFCGLPAKETFEEFDQQSDKLKEVYRYDPLPHV